MKHTFIIDKNKYRYIIDQHKLAQSCFGTLIFNFYSLAFTSLDLISFCYALLNIIKKALHQQNITLISIKQVKIYIQFINDKS